MLGVSGYLVAGITFWPALCKWLCGLLSRAAPTWKVLCGWQAGEVWGWEGTARRVSCYRYTWSGDGPCVIGLLFGVRTMKDVGKIEEN